MRKGKYRPRGMGEFIEFQESDLAEIEKFLEDTDACIEIETTIVNRLGNTCERKRYILWDERFGSRELRNGSIIFFDFADKRIFNWDSWLPSDSYVEMNGEEVVQDKKYMEWLKAQKPKVKKSWWRIFIKNQFTEI